MVGRLNEGLELTGISIVFLLSSPLLSFVLKFALVAGLDVLELFPQSKEELTKFWVKFNQLLLELFSYPKLIFSAITGHSPAGGTVLSIMTDYRIMAEGNYKIGYFLHNTWIWRWR